MPAKTGDFVFCGMSVPAGGNGVVQGLVRVFQGSNTWDCKLNASTPFVCFTSSLFSPHHVVWNAVYWRWAISQQGTPDTAVRAWRFDQGSNAFVLAGK